MSTPNMGLFESTPLVTTGPLWAQNIEDSLLLVDAHDHSAGKGLQVTPAGLNINSELSFNSQVASNLFSAKFISQGAALPGSNVRTLYSVGADLYFNNGSGTPIQITSGGAVNVSGVGGITGLGSTTAALTYFDFIKTFVFTQDSGITASVDHGPLTIRENIFGAQGITLQSPAALAASYSITLLPTLPVTTQPLRISPTGVLTAAPLDSSMLAANLTLAGTVNVGALISAGIVSAGGTLSTGANLTVGTTIVAGGDITSTGGGVFADALGQNISSRNFRLTGTSALNFNLIQATLGTFAGYGFTQNAPSAYYFYPNFTEYPAIAIRATQIAGNPSLTILNNLSGVQRHVVQGSEIGTGRSIFMLQGSFTGAGAVDGAGGETDTTISFVGQPGGAGTYSYNIPVGYSTTALKVFVTPAAGALAPGDGRAVNIRTQSATNIQFEIFDDTGAKINTAHRILIVGTRGN